MAASIYQLSADEAASISSGSNVWIDAKRIDVITVIANGGGNYRCVVYLDGPGVASGCTTVTSFNSVFTSEADALARAAVWVERAEDAK